MWYVVVLLLFGVWNSCEAMGANLCDGCVHILDRQTIDSTMYGKREKIYESEEGSLYRYPGEINLLEISLKDNRSIFARLVVRENNCRRPEILEHFVMSAVFKVIEEKNENDKRLLPLRLHVMGRYYPYSSSCYAANAFTVAVIKVNERYVSESLIYDMGYMQSDYEPTKIYPINGKIAGFNYKKQFLGFITTNEQSKKAYCTNNEPHTKEEDALIASVSGLSLTNNNADDDYEMVEDDEELKRIKSSKSSTCSIQ